MLAHGDKRMLYRIRPPSCPQQWASHKHQAACRAMGPLLSSQFHLTYLNNNLHINSTQNVELRLKEDRNFYTFLYDSLLIRDVIFFLFPLIVNLNIWIRKLTFLIHPKWLNDEKSLAWTQLRPTYVHRCRICTGSWPW